MPSSSLASHLMLDSTYATGYEHRRDSSSTSSLSSSSLSSFSASPDHATTPISFPNSELRISTRSSTRLQKAPPPPQTFALGRPPQHVPQRDLKVPSTNHSRQSSLSTSEHSSDHGAGVQKRTTTTRRARADSAPYPRDLQQQQGSSNGGRTPEEELGDLLARSGMQFESGSSAADDEDWGDSRRSSVSSSGWSTYDPALASPAEEVEEGEGSGYFPGSEFLKLEEGGPMREMNREGHGGRDPVLVRQELEMSAAKVMMASNASAQDRARGAFVQDWLGCSYELSNGEGAVDRQALYASYAKSCPAFGVRAINSASFGKAVRQKFLGIKTRRLGVRGNSRYHYCGLRPTNAEEAEVLAQLTKEEQRESISPTNDSSPIDASSDHLMSGELSLNLRRQSSAPAFFPSSPLPTTPTTARPTNPSDPQVLGARRTSTRSISIVVPSGTSYGGGEKTLGGAATAVPIRSQSLPGFPSIEEALMQAGSSVDPRMARAFWADYAEHCHTLLEAVRSYRFDQFELNLRTWWASLDEVQRTLVANPAISTLLYRSDAAIYDDILEFLQSQILVNVPPQAFASLRGLADHMERIQTVALAAFEGTAFPGPKVELAARFGHLVTRHLGLCQLTQALNGIVSNVGNMRECAESWEQIDFESIKNQAALVSNCEHDLLTECFESFKTVLFNPGRVPIETFIRWADQCFERICTSSEGQRRPAPRSLLVRWSFVSSQIIRDLTLRSAPSFGSFQIISLFLEEFLSFQVLRRVALQISAIAASVEAADHPYGNQQHAMLSPMGGVGNASYPVGPPNPGPYLPTTTLVPTPTSFTTLDQFSPTTRHMFETATHQPHLLRSHPPHDDADLPTSGYNVFASFETGATSMDYETYGMDAYGLSARQNFGARTEMDVEERFGDLRFDSSPSAAGSPEVSISALS